MLPSASPLSSPRSPFSPSQRPEEEIAFFGRHNLRKIHGCAPEEYTPPKEYSMPKAEIPIEVAPSGAWPALDDDSWPPKGKCPCVPGDGSLRDLAGVGSVKRQRLQFEESPAAVVGGPNCDSHSWGGLPPDQMGGRVFEATEARRGAGFPGAGDFYSGRAVAPSPRRGGRSSFFAKRPASDRGGGDSRLDAPSSGGFLLVSISQRVRGAARPPG